MPDLSRVYAMPFAKVHQAYVAKAERKGRTREEVDETVRWLTGYSQEQLELRLQDGTDLQGFFAQAPGLNPARELVTGAVCGVRVETVQDPLMREIRRLDKLVDELAKGRPMDRILRKA
jgi:hypothetical protein